MLEARRNLRLSNYRSRRNCSRLQMSVAIEMQNNMLSEVSNMISNWLKDLYIIVARAIFDDGAFLIGFMGRWGKMMRNEGSIGSQLRYTGPHGLPLGR